MRRLPLLLIFGLTLTSHFSPAFAGVVVSSFGPGDVGLSISTIGSTNDYETALAVAFTPSTTFTLAQIDLSLGWLSGTNSFLVYLRNDNDDPTGSVIESWTSATLPFGQPDMDLLTSTGGVVLNAGTIYWIELIPGGSDTYGAWNVPSPDTYVGELAGSRDRGVTWYPPVNGVGPAFDVMSTTPEGNSALLVCVGLAVGRLPVYPKSPRRFCRPLIKGFPTASLVL